MRKRKPHKSSPFGLTTLAEALGSDSRSRSVETIERTFPVCSAPAQTSFILQPFAQPTGGQTTFTQQPVTSQGVQVPPPAVVQVAPTGVITDSGPPPAVLVKQTCISCGNVRSPRYQLRHLLKPGEMPRISICRKCSKKETSSEDSDSSYERYRRRKKDRHRHRHSSETTEDGHSKSRQERSRWSGRYHSPRRHGSHRSTTQSDSTDRTRPAFVTSRASRRPRRSSTPERVRIVRRIRYVDPAHQSRSRGPSRTSTSRHSNQAERSEDTHVYHGDHLDDISSEDEIPRKHKAQFDRRYETVMETETPILRRRSNSVLVEQEIPINADRQEFNDGHPVLYTSQDDNRPTTRGRSFEREPSVEVEEVVRPPSRSARVVQLAPELYEQPLRSRTVVPDFNDPRPRSRSIRTVHVAQDSDEPRPRSGLVRTFHVPQDSDESRPRSRSVRVLRVFPERGNPRSFATAGIDPERVVLESRSRRPPPINVHQHAETLVRPRSTSRHRVPETSDDADSQGKSPCSLLSVQSNSLQTSQCPVMNKALLIALTVSSAPRQRPTPTTIENTLAVTVHHRLTLHVPMSAPEVLVSITRHVPAAHPVMPLGAALLRSRRGRIMWMMGK